MKDKEIDIAFTNTFWEFYSKRITNAALVLLPLIIEDMFLNTYTKPGNKSTAGPVTTSKYVLQSRIKYAIPALTKPVAEIMTYGKVPAIVRLDGPTNSMG